MLIPMDDVVVIVVSGNINSFSSKMMQTQMIVVVEPRTVMDRRTIVEIQPRYCHNARIRRPHALKRRRCWIV